MPEIDDILEGEGLSKDRLEAALELARLVADETGLCCQQLGQFCWDCYLKLEPEEEEE
ncbi:hypothetical protein ACFLY3_04670 [Chloroflexota bacterium]